MFQKCYCHHPTGLFWQTSVNFTIEAWKLVPYCEFNMELESNGIPKLQYYKRRGRLANKTIINIESSVADLKEITEYVSGQGKKSTKYDEDEKISSYSPLSDSHPSTNEPIIGEDEMILQKLYKLERVAIETDVEIKELQIKFEDFMKKTKKHHQDIIIILSKIY
ncbi:uncharacterized protein G2W53_017711 [Senna tora]|uniref:Uncharacterized protein n=1 Tax=Senna tora TaxID=362788 RepID=A0A834TRD2_9FABA|nr:uncharacterized protein G2W53_017711 [Senna tora]